MIAMKLHHILGILVFMCGLAIIGYLAIYQGLMLAIVNTVEAVRSGGEAWIIAWAAIRWFLVIPVGFGLGITVCIVGIMEFVDTLFDRLW